MTKTTAPPAQLDATFDAALEFAWNRRFTAQTRRTRSRTLSRWNAWCEEQSLDVGPVSAQHVKLWLESCAGPDGASWGGKSYQYARHVLLVAVEYHQRFAKNWLACDHEGPICVTRKEAELACRAFKRRLRVAHTPIEPAAYRDVQHVLAHVPPATDDELSRWTRTRLAVDFHLTPEQLAGIQLADLRHSGSVTTFIARSLTGSALTTKTLRCDHIGLPQSLPVALSCVRCGLLATERSAIAAGSATLFSDQSSDRIRAALGRVASRSAALSWADGVLSWTQSPRRGDVRPALVAPSVGLGRERAEGVLVNAALALAATTGLRMAHLATIRRADITIGPDGATLTYTVGHKQHQRTVSTATAMNALRHLDDWVRFLDAHPGTDDDTLVFTAWAGSVDGLRYRVNRQIRRHTRQLGLNRFTYAQCREMFRCVAMSGMSDGDVARAMHHSSVTPLAVRGLTPRANWPWTSHPESPRRRLQAIAFQGTARHIVAVGNQQTGTVDAYVREWRRFADWCSHYGLLAQDAEPALVVTYLHSRYPDLALSTVRNILSAIQYHLRRDLNLESTLVASYCQAVRNTLGTERNGARVTAILDDQVDAAIVYRRAVRAAERSKDHYAQAAAVIVAAYALGGTLNPAGLTKIRDSVRLTVHPDRAKLTCFAGVGVVPRTHFVSAVTDPVGYQVLATAAALGPNPFLGPTATAPDPVATTVVPLWVTDAARTARRRADVQPNMSSRRAALDYICEAALHTGTLDVEVPAAMATPQVLNWLRDHRFIQRVHGSGRWRLLTVPPESISGDELIDTLSSVERYLDSGGMPAEDKAVLRALVNAIRQAGVMPAQVDRKKLQSETHIHRQTCGAILGRNPHVVTAYPGVRRGFVYMVHTPAVDPQVAAQVTAIQSLAEKYSWPKERSEERAALMRLADHALGSGRLQLPAEPATVAQVSGAGASWPAISNSLSRAGWLTYKRKGWVLTSPDQVKPANPRPLMTQGRLVAAALVAAAVDPMDLGGVTERDWLLANLVPGLAEHLRDNALVCVGHFHGRRGTDLVRLDIADVSPAATGFMVRLGRHKASIEGNKPTDLDVPHNLLGGGKCAARCPACALAAHLEGLRRRGVSDGPLFPSARARLKHIGLGRRRLQAQTVRQIVVRVFEGVPGVDSAVLGARSLRRGRVTTMAASGASSADIAQHIGHSNLEHTLRYDASTVTAQL